MNNDLIDKCRQIESEMQEEYSLNRSCICEKYSIEFTVLEGYFDFTYELGGNLDKLIPQWKKPVLQFVLLRIHERALKVAREAKILLENGSASGAMARWRTLYEFSVVARVLIQFPELAVKYVEHVAVDDYKYARKLVQYKDRLNLRDYNLDAFEEIKESCDRIKRKYGWKGTNDYEWAINDVIRKADLFELARAVELEHLYAYVDEANKYNHPSMRYLLNDRGAHPSENTTPPYTLFSGDMEQPVNSESCTPNYLFSSHDMEIPIQLIAISLQCINCDAITAYSRLDSLKKVDLEMLEGYAQYSNDFPSTIIELITQRLKTKEDTSDAH